ncbi:uncharacterized protein LOC124138779 [Haliotis rufescens]|uniref:uncharacterized protein LOC124138779 n=1 Tax=Haliotis rufescens TaxID=6454 RepID=UPI00201EFDC1|nr:uncharacterized protein LOC124138779 [Haliotis rufescens]
MEASFLLVVGAILATAIAGPISVRQGDEDMTSCAKSCTGTSKFNYVPGTTYEFVYNVQTQTSMEGASSERASLGIRASADIEVLSKCEMALRLRDVKVYRSDPYSSNPMKYADETGEFKRNLERFPLRFSFQDGVVEELCPADGETTWALNIKRGLLTAVQNSMDRIDTDQRVKERDIAGSCYTDYKVTNSGWYSTSIKKVKDILGCTDRHGYQSSVHAMPYRVPSDIQSMPLMKSTHENDQELDKNGRLKSALITETHTFRPFSQDNNGATTKVLQRLNFKSERSGVTTRPDLIGSRTGLIYEHVYGNGQRAEPRREAENKLQEICRDTREDVRPDTPRLFSELVYIIRNMDVTTLNGVYNQVKRGSLCSDNNERTMKFFTDAIPMASTGAAVQFLTELLTGKDVTGTQAEMWITSLALIHHPTLEMLENVKALVESPELSLKAMLPVSTMINNYCSHNPSCSDEIAVTNILSSLEKNIDYGCYVRDNKLNRILMTLRAIGNAGHSERVVDSIRNCFTKEGNPIEVRVAAVEAFRRLPCSADRNEVMTIYRDGEEDSELRIAAYLALMRCPSEDVLSRIQETLVSEKANQVGSFVWSHLTNLMETASPQKQTIRRILEDKTLQREFDLETLKYSRNYEGSLFLEKFNTGAMVDSNLIFSEKSFVPRSAMMNLTVDLFGNSINLLEIGGRIEGLEYLLETYLGPYGYFGDKNSNKKNTEQSRADLGKLRGAMYMRIFGNEMLYKHFKGMESLTSASKFNFLEFLIKMSKKHDYSFTQSMMILDSSMIIPTSSGLPLNLTVNGTATINFKASGQVDLRKVSTKPRSLLIDGTIQPSGAIQIAGTMSMDAFVTKSGLRVFNTWHSSTALKGRVELTRGKILSAELELPQQKMEIFDVKTTFFSIHGDLEQEEKLITENRQDLKLCTGERLAQITGVELCNEFHWANASLTNGAPYFPFTGPFSYSMTLIKRDSHSGYKLLAKRTENKVSSTAQLTFDTPGSRVNRALSMDVTVNYKNKELELEVVSPWKKATVRGNLDTDQKLLGVGGNLLLDDKDEYGLVGQVKIVKGKDAVTYKPRFEIRQPGARVILLSGSVNTQGSRKATTDLSLEGITAKPVMLKSNLQSTKNERSMTVVLNLGKKDGYSLDASLINRNTGKNNPIIKIIPRFVVSMPEYELINLNGNSLYKPQKLIDGDMSLSIYKVLPKPLTASWKLGVNSRKNVEYKGSVRVRSRFVNVRLEGGVDLKKKNIVSSKLTVDYSVPALKFIKPNKFDISSKFTNRSTKSTLKYNLNANFVLKQNQDWNFQTDLDFTHNKKQTGGSMQLKYGNKDPTKTMSTTVDINHEVGAKSANVKYDMQAKFPPKEVDIRLKGKHKHDKNTLVSNVQLDYAKGKAIKAFLNLKDSSKKAMKMSGIFNLDSPFKDINLKTDLTQKKRDFTHQITLKLDKAKSTVVTTYSKQKGTIHSVDSQINLHSMNPTRVMGEIDLDLKDFRVSGKVDHAKKSYGVATAYKYTKDPKGKWSLDLTYPARHIIVEVEGGKKGTIYAGSVDAKWNAGNDTQKKVNAQGSIDYKSVNDIDSSLSLKYPSRVLKLNVKHQGGNTLTSHADLSWSSKKQISLDTTYSNQGSYNSRNIQGSIKLQTPFRKFEEMSAEMSTDNRPQKYTSTAKLIWGSQGNAINGAIVLKKPYSPKGIDLRITASSPFKGYRRMNAELEHSISDQRLNTNIKGAFEGRNAEFTISAQNKGDLYDRDVAGSFVLRSNIPKMKSIALQMEHKDDNRKFVTEVTADVNGDRYQYNLGMTHALTGWQYQNAGELTLMAPKIRMTNTWTHRNTGRELKTTLTSEWGRERKVHFDLSGNHDSSARYTTTGGIILQTPWEPVKDIDISLNNAFGRGYIRSISHFKKDKSTLASSEINYRRSTELAEFDFIITTPVTQDLKGKLNSRYNSYPMSSHLEFEWAPRKMISADGAIDLASIENLDGELRITTPYRNFRNILLKSSHKYENSEWLSDARLDYAPRKSIELESHINTGLVKKARVTLKTPFDDLSVLDAGIEFSGGLMTFDSRADFELQPTTGKYTAVMNWNYANSDVSGKLRIDTPLETLRYMQMILSSQKQNNGKRHSRIEVEYHPKEKLFLDVTYKLNSLENIHLNVMLGTPFENIEHVSVTFNHALRRRGIESEFDVTYAPYRPITGLLKLSWNNDIDGSVMIATPFRSLKTLSASIRHEGEPTDFKSHAELQFNSDKTCEMDIKFKHGDRTKGSFSLKTPFTNFGETKASVYRRGGIRSLQSGLTLTYADAQEIEATFTNRLTSSSLDSVLLIKAPFTDDIHMSVDHNGQLTSFTNKLEGSVGSTYSLSSQTGFTLRKPTIDFNTNLRLKCDQGSRNIGITFHKEGQVNNMNSYLTGEYNGKRIEIRGALKMITDIDGSLTIQTPFEPFRDIGMTVKHSGNMNRFNSEGVIRYMDGQTAEGTVAFSHNGIRRIDTKAEIRTPFTGSKSATYHHTMNDENISANAEVQYGTGKKITAEVSAMKSPKIDVSAEVRTPFQSFEVSKLIISHEGPLGNCKSHAEFEMAGKTMTADSSVMHGESSKLDLVILTNMEGYESLKIKANREGTLRNLRTGAQISLRDAVSEVSLNNRFTGRRLVTAFVLRDPYIQEITFNIDHNGILSNFKSQVSANMGRDATLTGNVVFNMEDLAINMESNVAYTMAGSGNNYAIKLGKHGRLEDLTAFLTANCGDKNINIKAALRSDDNIHGEVSVVTPFEDFTDLALKFDHSGVLNSFSSEGTIRYMDGKELSGKINHMNNRLRRIQSSIEVKTPFSSYEFTKVEYRHRGDSNSLKCNADVQYGSQRKMSAEMSMGKSMDRYVLVSKLSTGRRNTFSLDSTVDLSTSPMTATATLKTPLENFDNNEISISHNGEWKNFRSTLDMKSPLISTVSGEAALHYTSPFEMDALVSLTDNLKLSVENTLRRSRQRSHIVAAWAPRKQITLDGSYVYSSNFAEKQLSADASLSTPFKPLRQAALKIQHSRGDERSTQTIEADYNGETVLDVDMEYHKANKHESIITFRKPRAMQYTVSGEFADNSIDTDLFVNWDRDEPESNVRFQTSLNDQSGRNTIDKAMTIKLIHPARTLGVTGTIAKSGSQTKSVGQLIWNEDAGQMFSYDLDLTDKSRRYSTMYDGSLRLGTPVRGFQMDGSFSNAQGRKIVDGTFFWDAVRDQTKQVGIKAVLSPSDVQKRAELSLRLPSIGKDIKVDTELTLNDGRTLFDGKTELSYSSDSRKTLTLSSKVEDISYGYSNKNYSMTVAISHPYTDVDVSLTSNIGMSREKYTSGMNAKYLTARRERKNFALRGEINRIRKQLDLQMMSPLTTMTLSGEVDTTNPYHLRISNNYGDDRTLKCVMTFDKERRFVDFQTNYDLDNPSNTINLHANYINSTAVKAELYSTTNSGRLTDSLVFVRLNTSRILHTRISWRPEVVQETQEYLTYKVRRFGQKAKSEFHDIYESVGREITGKYQRIATAFSEDIAPFVTLVESEMASIEAQLDDIRRDIRRMYSRNDLYIADLGETFLSTFESYKDFVTATKARFAKISEAMTYYLEEVKNYPINREYQEMVSQSLSTLKTVIDYGVTSAVDIIGKIDDQLKALKDQYQFQSQRIQDGVSESINRIKNHPRLIALKARMSDIDYQRYITMVQERVNSWNIPEKYNSVIYNAREMINSNLANVLEHEDVKHMRSVANNVYQEGVWAYNYWQVEENLQKHLSSIYEIIKEMVEEEIQKYRQYLNFLEKSKVTVWDPEHGEIQMDVYLPIPLKSLDSLPEVDSYVDRVKNAVDRYTPDRETIKQYYDKYMPNIKWRSANQTKPSDDQFTEELNEFVMKKSLRQRRRYRARSI